MDPLQTGTLVTTFLGSGEAHSALPGAPTVLSADEGQVAVRARGAVAGALHRLADAVAPATSARPAPRSA
jgi:hypothetical protein